TAPPAQSPSIILAGSMGALLRPSRARKVRLMSVYLLVRHQLWVETALATAALAAVCYWVSRPIPGLGIAEPVFVLSFTTAIVALLLSRETRGAASTIWAAIWAR